MWAVGLAFTVVAALAGAPPPAVGAGADEAANLLFLQHCAQCHGVQRYGGYAPPLIPQSLQRRKDAELEQIILKGRPQTQMPAFAEVLRPEQVKQLLAHIRTPVPVVRWEMADIRASRQEPEPVAKAYTPPAHPGRVVLVVERGLGQVVVLDGDTMERLDTFPVGPIHGGPKFTDDYATVFSTTRDGTVVRYSMHSGQVEARVKVAVNTRNIAVSPDGAWVAAVNQLPANLVLLDGKLNPVAVVPLEGAPSAVYHLPGTQRFVLTLRNAPTMVMVEYPSMQVERRPLPLPFEDFTFVPGRAQALASARGGKQVLLYDLESGNVPYTLDTTGLPHLFSATYFKREGRLHAALNHIGVPTLSILDLDRHALVRQFTLKGAGYFVRTHPGTPWLWADTNTEALQLVDKATLTLREVPLVPQTGRKAMHVEFTADGAQAMVSIWHPQGAMVVYDAKNLTEIRRMPFNMPIGKYNARNKTHFPLE